MRVSLLSHAPGTVLGFRRDGRPIFPIAGGAEDDAGTEQSETDDSGAGDGSEDDEADVDWKARFEAAQAEAEKHKANSRKWEGRSKSNADAAKELERVKREGLSEAERAISDARAEGESAAAAKYRSAIARHALNAAAAQAQKTVPEAAVGRMDLSDLVADDGTVDADALKEIVSGFAPAAGAKPAGPPPDPAQRANRGRGQGGKQNADDLLAAGADLYRSTFPKN